MKKSKQGSTSSTQFVQCPIELVRCGNSLSSPAKIVYAVLASYNPSYPGVRRIAEDGGLSTSTVQGALKELLKCRIVHKTSGRLDRTNNRYGLFLPKNWKLPKDKKADAKSLGGRKGVSPSDTGGVSPSDTPPPQKRVARRYRGVSLGDTGGVSLGDTELDQYKIDQLITGGASRYLAPEKCASGVLGLSFQGEPEVRGPDGQDQTARQEGVGLPADNIATKTRIQVQSTIDELNRQEAERKDSIDQFRNQLKALHKALNAGAITQETFQAKVKEIAALTGQPTFFVESAAAGKNKGTVGSGVRSNFHARV